MKNQLNTNAKTIDNRPTIDQKSNKNEPKISLGGVSGVTWGLLAARIEKTQMEYQLVGPLEIPTEYYIQKSKEKKELPEIAITGPHRKSKAGRKI